MPLQLVRMGQFAVLGVPAEVTTVAGRRLQQAAAKELNRAGVETTAVSTYTNGYAQYITTAKEYDTQQYEGASTLYGRSTCEAVVKATVEIARAVTGRSPVVHDGPLADLRPRVITKRRMTFRNDSRRAVRFRLYLPLDVVYLATMWGGADFTVAPGTERAIVLPFPWSLFVDMVQVVWGSAHQPQESAQAAPLRPVVRPGARATVGRRRAQRVLPLDPRDLAGRHRAGSRGASTHSARHPRGDECRAPHCTT
ncbi:MAG: neutral/alkaline non-lysosomal ceramidase N-terminal domain-containing protein [Gemmatimonadetes bacterium]|nr:neutral/alkaline non-lysosomal ceramidase N-terminal domain-containing protein [Gemmatimonadota bacterium]